MRHLLVCLLGYSTTLDLYTYVDMEKMAIFRLDLLNPTMVRQ